MSRDTSGVAALRTLRRLMPVLACCGAAVLLAAALYQDGWWRFNHPSPRALPVRGIDISHYQGIIDWQTVRQAHLAFAYIKATEGADRHDPRFAANWTAARAAGLIPGAYHYFTVTSPGSAQAANVASTVPLEDRALPPAVDFECLDRSSDPPPIDVVVQELTACLDGIQAHFGTSPVIYTTWNSYRRYIAGAQLSNPIWIRDLFFQPELPQERPWLFWQYANNGRIPGVTGNIDLDVFVGPERLFDGLFRPERLCNGPDGCGPPE